MQVIGWNNGAWNESGAGYGIKLESGDRDRYFDRSWPDVLIELPSNGSATVKLSPSFWTRCRELRSKEIGLWMRVHGFSTWPRGRPPRLELTYITGRTFRLSLLAGVSEWKPPSTPARSRLRRLAFSEMNAW